MGSCVKGETFGDLSQGFVIKHPVVNVSKRLLKLMTSVEVVEVVWWMTWPWISIEVGTDKVWLPVAEFCNF